MTTDTTVCSVCYRRHLNTLCTNWCVECEDALCSDCKEHHIASKATRIHKIIQISEYKSLPSFVTDINQLCVYHNQKYQLYCVKHECAICNKCTKEHGKCSELISLEEWVTDITTSEKILDLEDSLADLLENFQKIRKDRQFNITRIKDQKETITEELRLLKSQVVQYFEELEKEFIQELEKNTRNCCESISSVISLLNDKEQEIHQMISDIQNIKKYASDLQTFLCMKDIQTKTSENEASLRTLIGNKSLETIIIESTFETKVHDILTIKRFGFINLKNLPSSNIDIYKRKDRQAQIMVPKPETSVNNIKYEFQQKIKTSCRNPYGCDVSSKGEFLFSNYDKQNETLLVMNTADKVEYSIPLTKPYSSFDVVYLGNTTCAVSTGYSDEYRGISIVNLNSRKVTKFIELPGDTFGITYDGTSLICCIEEKDIHVISCADYSITTIPNSTSTECSYVSSYAGKIFFTNPTKNGVTCCLYSGDLVWEVKDENMITNPRGLTVDDNGNVFVVGRNSCNVVVISPDGKHCKQILTHEEGLDKPTAICFDKVRNQLIVTNKEHFANVYKNS